MAWLEHPGAQITLLRVLCGVVGGSISAIVATVRNLVQSPSRHTARVLHRRHSWIPPRLVLPDVLGGSCGRVSIDSAVLGVVEGGTERLAGAMVPVGQSSTVTVTPRTAWGTSLREPEAGLSAVTLVRPISTEAGVAVVHMLAGRRVLAMAPLR